MSESKRVHHAVHPGTLLREELADRGMTQAELAELSGRPVAVLNAIINGKKSITADTALDLEQALGNKPEYWLHAQVAYELDRARTRRESGGLVHLHYSKRVNSH